MTSSIRIFGKAMAAAGKQAARNARHKPDAVAEASSGNGRSRSKVTSQLGMSLEEAHLILNTKKTDNMETIMAVSTPALRLSRSAHG